jgi:hypothetical protein
MRGSFSSLAAASTLFVLACGPIFGVDFDGHPRPTGSDEDAGALASEGGATEAPPSGPNSGNANATDAGGDARGSNEPDAASRDALAAATDASAPPIEPLTVGNTWTYQVTEVGSMPACPSGSYDLVVLDQEAHDGETAFALRPFCTGLPVAYYTENGDIVQRDYSGAWETVVAAPVVDGHTWTNSISTYRWHDIGSYTVPAGTFSSCFDLVDLYGPSHTVMCRGVGPVYQVLRRATTGDGYDATLTAKNF